MIRPRADELDGAAPRSSRDGREQMSREAPKPAYDRLWVARSALLKRIAAVPSPTRSRSQEAPDVIVHPTRHRATARQITLAWLLRRSPAMLPIPGTLSLDHLKQNLAALKIELTDAEFEALR